MVVENKKDCPLYCGKEGIRKIRFFWRYDGKDLLINLWLAISIPVFVAIAYGFLQKSLPENIILVGLIAIAALATGIGSIIACLFIVWEIDDRRRRYNLVVPRTVSDSIERSTKLAGNFAKAFVIKIWEAGSPILLVWLASAYLSGEFGTLASDETFRLFYHITVAICLPGCWHDAKYLFKDEAEAVWQGRNDNAIGSIERMIVRGFGYVLIYSKRCDIIKARKS